MAHFESYPESVLEAADNDGYLSHADAVKLLRDHGFTFDDVIEDSDEFDLAALVNGHAETLLAWLGH